MTKNNTSSSYNTIIIVIYIILIIVFFISLVVMVKKSNIIGYRVISENLEEETINYNKLQHKYDIKKCSDVCKKELCDQYQVQQIKYDLCKECKREGKCYDPNEGICKFCLDFRSCETLYGCNNNQPINPSNNYCQQCWST